MFDAMVKGLLIGLAWTGVWKLCDLVYELRKIRFAFEQMVDVLRDYQVDVVRDDHGLVDLMCEICKQKSDPSGLDQMRDDLLALELEDLPDWPVEDTRKEEPDDEA